MKNDKKLYEEVISEIGNQGLREIEIPGYIVENISKELRPYQENGLKYYFGNKKYFKKRHLMFNMATGSGKTLMMASLILDCYKEGYRDFIFFVNSTAILEKTKYNFADKNSNKYLFKENIIIDSKNVEINIIDSLDDSKEDCINIHFTTIQTLYSILKRERENAITFDDLVDRKLVFLADEAHHLNADTKKNKTEYEIKEGWEAIINKAFNSNNKNLMFEFSATIPDDKNVLEKYRDKIIYEYALKEFCLDGYSKRIFLVKYDNQTLESRFLGAILLSLYREIVASKNDIVLKPVILFKSENIAPSQENHKKFIEFVENIDDDIIRNFYSNIKSKNSAMLFNSKNFFEEEYGDSMFQKLAEHIRISFKENYTLNTNNDVELEKNQILLNSLEESDNLARAIFAVDKLNEGWDVLNLFDIVRLGDKKKTSAATTQETQLIGRGARYYPFKTEYESSELQYKRKFDNDAENPLSELEKLTYHTLNDVDFISKLNEAMADEGLLIEDDFEEIKLEVNPKLESAFEDNKVFYATNRRYKKKDILGYKIDSNEIEHELKKLKIPLFANKIEEVEETFEAGKVEEVVYYSAFTPNDKIDVKYFLKAMNIEKIDFAQIKGNFEYTSKREFIEKYIGNIIFLFSKKQEFNEETCLEIAKFIVRNFKSAREIIKQEYEVSDFEVGLLSKNPRSIYMSASKVKEVNYDWLLYNKINADSDLEMDFLSFIDSKKDSINKEFCEWFVIRNDGFKEFKIYDNRKGEPTYSNGFEPDFIFFGKREKGDRYFGIECFMEAKGGHLAIGLDAWKERFLETLRGQTLTMEIDKALDLYGLPFFIALNDDNFDERFDEFIKR